MLLEKSDDHFDILQTERSLYAEQRARSHTGYHGVTPRAAILVLPRHPHAVIGRVEPHIARALRRVYILDDLILIRSVLMNHRERTIRIRGKRVARDRVERHAVHASADRERAVTLRA